MEQSATSKLPSVAIFLGASAVLICGLVLKPVRASTATSTFQVSATVPATCQISATNLSFGNFTGAQVQATSTISVTCTDTTPYTVGLGPGTASGATVTSRAMTGPSSATLGYGLYSDSTDTTNWGNTAGTNEVSGTGTGSAQTLTVYGLIPAGTMPIPGSYTDTITVTVTY